VSEIITIRAQHKGIHFYLKSANLPEGVYGDERRLRQILLNLLGNAIKLTDQGSVTLKMSLNKLNSKIGFKIEETGMGISPEISVFLNPLNKPERKNIKPPVWA
jgi:signal transduction histidine kinase